MSPSVRRIGLSLGADLCWPSCFERILDRLDLQIPMGGETLRFETERITIEPFDLRQPCRYDVVLDRLTHWYHTSREWIKKALILNDVYVLNNPWALQSMEKQTCYCAMMRLGIHVPDTWMLPPKEYEPTPDLEHTLQRYAQMFDIGTVGETLGYPVYLKPYDGGGWIDITRAANGEELEEAYEQSGKRLMHVQKAIEGWDLFTRCVGIGPQLRMVRYQPSEPLHDRYSLDMDLDAETKAELRNITLTINAFFGWDFNSAEVLRSAGKMHPIDFANACPDSQVTSLHYHFPWLVKAKLRWALFCAATGRRFRLNQNWTPYLEVADQDLSYGQKMARYGAIAEEHFDSARFVEFCHQHLGHLDEVTYEFFGSEEARDTVRMKVATLYPEHEVDEFTELFWSRIQTWREREGHAEEIL
jgi:hypothetical protein